MSTTSPKKDRQDNYRFTSSSENSNNSTSGVREPRLSILSNSSEVTIRQITPTPEHTPNEFNNHMESSRTPSVSSTRRGMSRVGSYTSSRTRGSVSDENNSLQIDDEEEDDDDQDDEGDDVFDENLSASQRRKSKNRRLRIKMEPEHTESQQIIQTHADETDGEQSLDDIELSLKDRQEAINTEHPFGLPLWKPALYKKSRSITRNADSALHSTPVPSREIHANFGNILWTFVFGWWLASLAFLGSFILFLVTPFGGLPYARVLYQLANYLFWPFGKYVEKVFDNVDEEQQFYTQVPELAGSMYSSLNGEEAPETEPLLPRSNTSYMATSNIDRKSHMAKKLDFAEFLFYLVFLILVAPFLLLVSGICWFIVFAVPMGKLNYALFRYLLMDPLSIYLKSASTHRQNRRSVVLLCTYEAMGLKYYKYTIDGVNIMFINLLAVVCLAIIDDFFLGPATAYSLFFTSHMFIFFLALLSVIPLSYFIGMAVASISAQSSMGMGAVINATFGSLIEIILYCFALKEGKGRLTEGSIIGSLLAGVLLMPGVSMCSGALRGKEQRFNAKSAGVTSTMLIMAIIGTLSPTFFYQIYGDFEISCEECPPGTDINESWKCGRCHYADVDPIDDPFYQTHVKPLMYLCAIILLLSYLIGLWFTLRTHSKHIWSNPHHTQDEHRDMSMSKRLLAEMFPSLYNNQRFSTMSTIQGSPSTNRLNVQRSDHHHGPILPSLSAEDNLHLAHNVAEVAAAAATLAVQNQRRNLYDYSDGGHGHETPNWSRKKSVIVLLSCTALYAIVAEILIDAVDSILEHVQIDEKFLGLTLFALVPNTTEFMNAMSFAMQGNIALSMEIGSAYALQVCLLQIPAMVAFSAFNPHESSNFIFTLIFPRWDVFATIFSVFLLSYTYIEGKSNYFKGSILCLSYIVLMAGFYMAPSL